LALETGLDAITLLAFSNTDEYLALGDRRALLLGENRAFLLGDRRPKDGLLGGRDVLLLAASRELEVISVVAFCWCKESMKLPTRAAVCKSIADEAFDIGVEGSALTTVGELLEIFTFKAGFGDICCLSWRSVESCNIPTLFPDCWKSDGLDKPPDAMSSFASIITSGLDDFGDAAPYLELTSCLVLSLGED
jgi:hypothetical protein